MIKSILVAAAVVAAATAGAVAQDYPTKAVTTIVPYPAGASGDVIARIVGEQLSRKLGKSFVVDNRPGGAGVAATVAAKNAAPDGYTLLLTGLNHTTNVGLFKSLPYNPITDFEPVALVGSVPVVLVTRSDSGISSYEDLIAKAKASPGKLSFGSAGIGTGGHLASELMISLNGISMTHIPYKGATPALTDLISGQIDVLFTGVPPTLEHIAAGTLRPLVVSSTKRLSSLPDTRTGEEVGMKGFYVDVWFGLLAPKGTPKPIVELLARELAEVPKAPGNAERMEALGILVPSPGQEAFLERLKYDIATWPNLMEKAGVQRQ